MNDILPHTRILSSEIGESLARDKIERRTLMASRNGVRYAMATDFSLVCVLGKSLVRIVREKVDCMRFMRVLRLNSRVDKGVFIPLLCALCTEWRSREFGIKSNSLFTLSPDHGFHNLHQAPDMAGSFVGSVCGVTLIARRLIRAQIVSPGLAVGCKDPHFSDPTTSSTHASKGGIYLGLSQRVGLSRGLGRASSKESSCWGRVIGSHIAKGFHWPSRSLCTTRLYRQQIWWMKHRDAEPRLKCQRSSFLDFELGIDTRFSWTHFSTLPAKIECFFDLNADQFGMKRAQLRWGAREFSLNSGAFRLFLKT